MKRKLTLGSLAGLLVLAWMSLAAFAATTGVTIEVRYDQASARSMLSMINDFRKSDQAWAWDSTDTEQVQYTGLEDLVYDERLEQAAMQRAAEIAILFSHTRPDGSDCWSAGGWGTSSNVYGNACGENIAAGQTTAQAAFVSWREDGDPYAGQGHRRNMLGGKNGFTSIGIGHVIYNGRHFWVQEFGKTSEYVSSGPQNETVLKTISVEESFIADAGVAFSGSVQRISLIYHGTTQIPPASAYVYLKTVEENPDDSFFSRCPVIADLEWTAANTSVVSISGSEITGLKVGSTSISTSCLGRTLTVPAQVSQAPLFMCTIDVDRTAQYAYGEAVIPGYSVSLGSSTLAEGTDYTIAFRNNTDAGTASFTVTGKGNFTGTRSGNYTILPADLSDKVTMDEFAGAEYTGAVITLPDGFVPKCSGTALTEDDYTITYENNVEPGEAAFTVSGKNNYTGSKSFGFVITPVDLSLRIFDPIEDQTYTGSPIEPAVSRGDLPSKVQFTVSYEDNTDVTADAKPAKAVLTASGIYAKGTAQMTFAILPAPIDTAEVTVEDQVYTGSALTPVPVVTLGEKQLDPETDFELGENAYTDNVERGTASVTITGKGNYTGQVRGAFRIKGISLKEAASDGSLKISGIDDRIYSGSAFTPEVEMKLKGTALEEGTDYTRKDTDNTDAGTAKITISGTGTYEDDVIVTYAILPKDLSDAAVSAPDTVFNGKKQKMAPQVVLDEATLKSGTDYDTTWLNNVNAGTAVIKIAGKGNYTGSASGAFTIEPAALSAAVKIRKIGDQFFTGSAVKPAYQLSRVNTSLPMPVAGTDFDAVYKNVKKAGTASLTLTGKGNYTGTVSTTYNIIYRPVRTVFTTKTGTYKITKAGPSGTAQAAFTAPAGAASTECKIPATVTYGKVTYKVTSIAAKAFYGNQSIKKVTIGKNVSKIGTKAFYKCSRLRYVTFLTTGLGSKSHGTAVYRGTHKKIRFTVPALKFKSYRKWILAAGAPTGSTFVKK